MVATLPSSSVARKTTPAPRVLFVELVCVDCEASEEVRDARSKVDCEVKVESLALIVVAGKKVSGGDMRERYG